MIRTVIVEDEANALYSLQNLLQKHCPNIWVVGTADTVDEAEKTIAATNPDLVFMDVELQGELSFRIFEKLSPNIEFEVIFTTGHSEYALQAIKCSCLEYLLKPIDKAELVLAVQKFETKRGGQFNHKRIEMLLHNISSSKNKAQKIAIPSPNGFVFVNFSEIVLCEADSNYTTVHILDGSKLISTKNLKWFEEVLQEDLFFRCHKSTLVNLNHVLKYTRDEGHRVAVSGGHVVDVSTRKIDEFLEKIATKE